MIVLSESSLASVLLFTSLLLSVAFAVYGFNILYLTLVSRRYRQTPIPTLAARPPVAVHLPIYNELYVVERLLSSCARMAEHYGLDLVRIYVIDDSTDETRSEIDRVVSGFASRGHHLRVIRRGNRYGFKAGALQAALEETTEEYVAVFDADFVPPPDFLDRTVPALEQDQTVGFVQARWGHIDRNYSEVTKAVAVGVDAHFLLEQTGRNGNGYLMNFNGSCGVLRASAIRDAGGWDSDTLAEDLDVSYRMQLAGYRGVYVNDLEVPGELPPTITSLKRQQGRWARGSLQAAKKLAKRIGPSRKLSKGQKFEAAIHLTYYLVHPLMVASFLLAVSADFLRVDVIRYAVSFSFPKAGGGTSFTLEVAPWVFFSALVVLSTLAVFIYCFEAVRLQRLGLASSARQIIILVVLGYGISISNSVQALGGILLNQTGTFSRTPKYAIVRSRQTWKGKNYQIPFNKTNALEGGAMALAAAATAYAWGTFNLGIIPILLVYLTGYSFIFFLSVAQALGVRGAVDT